MLLSCALVTTYDAIIVIPNPSVVTHPRELMVGYSMGCGVGMVWSAVRT